MKKVLFTATVDSHILAFHLPFLKYFKELGYETHVATNGLEEIPYCDKKHTISFERSPFKLNNLKAIRALKKVLVAEKFDIVFTNTPMGSVVTRLACKKIKKKRPRVIYMAHGLHFYKGASLKNWLLFYPVEKHLSKYTDTLILINQEDYQLAKKRFQKCKDIQYVPGVGIDSEKFSFSMTIKEQEEVRNSLGLSMDDFVLIYPAELNLNKNQIFLIEVMEQLIQKYSNIHLLLPGLDSYQGKYQKMVTEKGLNHNIHFLGFRKDIPKLLKISNLSVATSYREGLAVNIMEAIATGLPIVATNVRGQRDLIEDGQNGFLIDLDDTKGFLNAIERLYQDQKLYHQMQKETEQLREQYYLPVILRKMEKIFQKKKVVIHLLASNQFSGAENVVCTIIKNTSEDYVHYYCSPDGPIRNILRQRNVKYIPLKKLNYFELKKVLKHYAPDIIHAHDNTATVVSSFFGNRFLVISHIHGNNKIMNSFNLKSLIFNYCAKRIRKIIWVSDSSYEGYFFQKCVKSKSIILYNIVNQKEIIKKSNEYICDDKYDIIFLGRLAYPKNPERFIEIVRMLKEKKENIKVAIVGDGNSRSEVERMISSYKLNRNVKLYGFQENPYPILKASKILVMTSIYEGTPMCALEAQALGKPIIATPVDGLKKIVVNGRNGYLSENDLELCNKILEYLNDSEIMNSISQNVKQEFLNYNNLDRYCQIIKECYEVEM